MAATIKDIAEETGLGLATISSYINGGHLREKDCRHGGCLSAQGGYARKKSSGCAGKKGDWHPKAEVRKNTGKHVESGRMMGDVEK